jgi:tetratricopeptide (TPR) repeat protein
MAVLSVSFLLAFVAIGCGSAQEKSKRHLDQADHWLAEGKTNEAILEYRRAVQLNPPDPRAHLALAKIFISKGDYLSAVKQLNNVIKNAPDNREAPDMLADLMVKVRNYKGAREQAQKILKTDPDDTLALMVLAESSFQLGDVEQAQTNADRVLQLDPTNSRGWFLKAVLQIAAQKKADGEASLLRAITYKPDYLDAVTLLAVSMARRGDLADSEKVIRQALEKNPQSVPVRYLLAAFLMAQNRNTEAEDVFKQIRTLGDSSPIDRGALARYYVRSGNLQGAIKEYQDILKRYPDDTDNSLQLASVYIEQGNVAGAEELVSAAAKKSQNDPNTLLFRGRLRLAKNQTEDGIIDLQHAAQLEPAWKLPQYFLGQAYAEEGKIDLAEGALNKALQLDPSYLPARLALAKISLQDGKPEQAIATIEKTVDQKPQIIDPYLVRTEALVEEGHYDEAEKDTLPLVEEFPQPSERAMTFRLLAQAKYYQNQFEAAHGFAKQSLAYESASQDSLYFLGASQIGLKKSDEGLAEVAGYINKNPKWAPGYETLGRLQAMAGRMGDAEASLKTAHDIDPSLISTQLLWTDIEITQGKLNEAMTLLSKLAESQPKFAGAQVRMGQLAEMKQDWNAAESYYKKALQLEPDNLLAKNNLAWVYAEHGGDGDLDLALKYAQEAQQGAPNNPSVSDTLGWILVKKKRYPTAIQLLRDSVQKDPKNAEYNYHLAAAYFGAGQKSQGEQYLQAALKLQPDIAKSVDAKGVLGVLEAVNK